MAEITVDDTSEVWNFVLCNYFNFLVYLAPTPILRIISLCYMTVCSVKHDSTEM